MKYLIQMNDPFISVIIPTYNRGKLLHRCLKSLDRQIFKNFEVIICDDASTDNTKTIVDSFKNSLKIRYFLINNNSGGPAKPRNIGIKKSKGKYVAFLDSDDYWDKYKLKKCIKFLNLGYDFVYHDLKVKSLKTNFKLFKDIILWFFLKKITFFNLILLFGNKINNSSVVVRSDLLKKVGSFNELEDAVAIEDYLMWLKILRVDIKFIKIDEILGFYGIQNDNISSHLRTRRYISFFNNLYKKELKKFSLKSAPWIYSYYAKYNFKKGNYVLFILDVLNYLYCLILILFNFKNLRKNKKI